MYCRILNCLSFQQRICSFLWESNFFREKRLNPLRSHKRNTRMHLHQRLFQNPILSKVTLFTSTVMEMPSQTSTKISLRVLAMMHLLSSISRRRIISLISSRTRTTKFQKVKKLPFLMRTDCWKLPLTEVRIEVREVQSNFSVFT